MMKNLEMSMSARRDIRIYLFLVLGLIFFYGGCTIDPSTNCSEGNPDDCAPWMIYVALVIGVLTTIGTISSLIVNHKWGFKLNLEERKLYWWKTTESPKEGIISLDDVSLIKVKVESESSDKIFFYDKKGDPLHFPSEEVAPASPEKWVQFISSIFPHIKTEILS